MCFFLCVPEAFHYVCVCVYLSTICYARYWNLCLVVVPWGVFSVFFTVCSVLFYLRVCVFVLTICSAYSWNPYRVVVLFPWCLRCLFGVFLPSVSPTSTMSLCTRVYHLFCPFPNPVSYCCRVFLQCFMCVYFLCAQRVCRLFLSSVSCCFSFTRLPSRVLQLIHLFPCMCVSVSRPCCVGAASLCAPS